VTRRSSILTSERSGFEDRFSSLAPRAGLPPPPRLPEPLVGNDVALGGGLCALVGNEVALGREGGGLFDLWGGRCDPAPGAEEEEEEVDLFLELMKEMSMVPLVPCPFTISTMREALIDSAETIPGRRPGDLVI